MDWTARVRTSLAGRGGADEGVVEELAQHAQAMSDSARADGATRRGRVPGRSICRSPSGPTIRRC